MSLHRMCKEALSQGKKVVTFGDIIMRLTPPDHQRLIQADMFEVTFAGAEADVAINLAQLGVPVDFVTRLPNNIIGDKCLNFLRQYGVGIGKILRGGERIGIYFVERGVGPRPSLVIYDKDYSAFATLKPGDINWSRVLSDAFWFHFSGINPATSSTVAEVNLEGVKVAKELGIIVSCDLNYRRLLWKWCSDPGKVMTEFVKHVDILFSNEEEVEIYFGIKPPNVDVSRGIVDQESYEYVAVELFRKFPNLRLVAFSLRKSISASHNVWMAVLHDGQHFYKSRSYDIIPIVDREGAGDSFAAAMIYKLIHTEDLQEALEFATAASCLKHTIPGLINIVSMREINYILEKGTGGRILR